MPEAAGAPPGPALALDHVGVIAKSLDAAAARWERLGFALSPASRQRGAVPDEDGVQPWATANRCAIFARGYLELIGVVDPRAHDPWRAFVRRFEGAHLLALRCPDADAAYRAIATRTDVLRPPVARERVLDVDGEARTMRFRNVFSDDARCPEGRWIVIEHQTPEYLWQPRYLAHPNGATGLLAATAVADHRSAPELAARIAAITGVEPEGEAGARRWRLPGGGRLDLLDPRRFEQRYRAAPQATPAWQAVTVTVREMWTVLTLLQEQRVPYAMDRLHLRVPRGAAGGVIVEFIEEEDA